MGRQIVRGIVSLIEIFVFGIVIVLDIIIGILLSTIKFPFVISLEAIRRIIIKIREAKENG